MCDKNYGRRDYLDRHIRTHDPDNQKKNINKIDWGTSGILVTEDGKKLILNRFRFILILFKYKDFQDVGLGKFKDFKNIGLSKFP